MHMKVAPEPLNPPQVRAEKPAWYLAVIAGAVLRSLNAVASRAADFLGYLAKGQLPPMHISLTAFQESFVLDGAAWLPAHSSISVSNGVYFRQMDTCRRSHGDQQEGTSLSNRADVL
jgi:hypothetical protein